MTMTTYKVPNRIADSTFARIVCLRRCLLNSWMALQHVRFHIHLSVLQDQDDYVLGYDFLFKGAATIRFAKRILQTTDRFLHPKINAGRDSFADSFCRPGTSSHSWSKTTCSQGSPGWWLISPYRRCQNYPKIVTKVLMIVASCKHVATVCVYMGL